MVGGIRPGRREHGARNGDGAADQRLGGVGVLDGFQGQQDEALVPARTAHASRLALPVAADQHDLTRRSREVRLGIVRQQPQLAANPVQIDDRTELDQRGVGIGREGRPSGSAGALHAGPGLLLFDDFEDDDEALSTKKTLTETTALLDRSKLLARIEQFQRQKDLRDGKSQAGRLAITAPPVSERAPLSVTGDLVAAVDPTDKVVLRSAGLRSQDPATIKKALLAPLTPTLAPFAVPLLANDVVELTSGHSRDDMRKERIEDLGGKASGLAHALEAFPTMQLDHAVAGFDPVVGIHGDIFGHVPHIGAPAGFCTRRRSGLPL